MQRLLPTHEIPTMIQGGKTIVESRRELGARRLSLFTPTSGHHWPITWSKPDKQKSLEVPKRTITPPKREISMILTNMKNNRNWVIEKNTYIIIYIYSYIYIVSMISITQFLSPIPSMVQWVHSPGAFARCRCRAATASWLPLWAAYGTRGKFQRRWTHGNMGKHMFHKRRITRGSLESKYLKDLVRFS